MCASVIANSSWSFISLFIYEHSTRISAHYNFLWSLTRIVAETANAISAQRERGDEHEDTICAMCVQLGASWSAVVGLPGAVERAIRSACAQQNTNLSWNSQTHGHDMHGRVWI